MDAVYLPIFHSFLKEILKEIRVSKEIFLPLPIFPSLHKSRHFQPAFGALAPMKHLDFAKSEGVRGLRVTG